MRRPRTDSKSPPSAPSSKQYTWKIYHIKGTPAILLGHVEAPDEGTAIKKAIDQFEIGPHCRIDFSRSAGDC
jgi:hypothetical protein